LRPERSYSAGTARHPRAHAAPLELAAVTGEATINIALLMELQRRRGAASARIMPLRWTWLR